MGTRCVALLLKIMSYVYTENVSNGENTIGLVRRVFELLRTCVLVNERVRSTLRRRTSRESTGSLKRRSSRDSTGSTKSRIEREKHANEVDDLSRLLRYATTFLVRIFLVETDDTNVENTEKLLAEFQDDWRGILSYAFVKCPIARIRNTVAENLLAFCEGFEKASSIVGSANGPRSALISACLSMLTENPHGEFFTLLTTLLRDASKTTQPFAQKDLKTIVEVLSETIIERPSKEEYEMEDKSKKSEVDFLLRGSLNVLSRILKKCREFEIPVQVSDKLFVSVFQDGLFASPTSSTSTSNVPKCKQSLTRSAAMYLLLQIAQMSTHARSKLLDMCCKHHGVPHVFVVTSSSSETDEKEGEEEKNDLPVATATAVTSQEQRAYPKSKTGFVGMLNLGNICYMNATNQQLFMIQNFREGILKSRSRKDTDENSVLYQLQRMFGYLRDGELQFYNPVRFCKVLKDWDGNSVNVAVQDDANLYFTKLMQNLEGNLEGTRSNPIRTNLSGLYGTEM